MKIIYFTRDYSPHDARFLAFLGQTGHQVNLLRLEGTPGGISDRVLPKNVNEIEWLGGKRLQSWIDYPGLLVDLKRVIKSFNPDIIHAGPIQRVASLVAQAGFSPLVSMSWGSDILSDAGSTAWLRWITRYTLQKTTVLVGDCKAVADKAIEYGISKDRIVVFPWGVDLKHFAPGSGDVLRKKLGWQDEIILLCTRSWEPLYGVDLVVKAFIKAVYNEPKLRLILLGAGSQEKEIRKLIDGSGMQQKVHFGGSVGLQDLPEVYRAADLYISASHSDGSSVSLMEAMACGIPALVSDISGNREWITNNDTGWLFKDGELIELTQGIIAASQRKDREKIGRNGRKLAEKKADWAQNSKKLLEAYDLALNLNKEKMKNERK